MKLIVAIVSYIIICYLLYIIQPKEIFSSSDDKKIIDYPLLCILISIIIAYVN